MYVFNPFSDFNSLTHYKHGNDIDFYEDMQSDGKFIYLPISTKFGRIFVFEAETLELVHDLELTLRPGVEPYDPIVKTALTRIAVNEEFLIANVETQLG